MNDGIVIDEPNPLFAHREERREHCESRTTWQSLPKLPEKNQYLNHNFQWALLFNSSIFSQTARNWALFNTMSELNHSQRAFEGESNSWLVRYERNWTKMVCYCPRTLTWITRRNHLFYTFRIWSNMPRRTKWEGSKNPFESRNCLSQRDWSLKIGISIEHLAVPMDHISRDIILIRNLYLLSLYKRAVPLSQ